MKKIISGLLALALVVTFAVRAEESFADVLSWMFNNKLTSYDTEAGFMPDDYLQRGQAAKFIATYGAMISLPQTYSNCAFNDVAGYDDTLTPFIQEACALGLLKGGSNMFWPSFTITQAQAIVMIVRIQNGMLDETGSPWYHNYSQIAKDNNILMDGEFSNTPDTTPVTRGMMAKWLYRANMLRNLDANPDAGTPTGDALISPEAPMPAEEKVIDPNAPHGYMMYDEDQVTAALAAGQDVVLYFFAGRCPNCQTLNNALDNDMAVLPAGTAIFKVDYDNANTLKMMYGVKTQHTFVHLNADGTAHAMSNSIFSIDALWAWLDGDMM